MDKEVLRESRLGIKIRDLRNESQSIPKSVTLKVISNLIETRHASSHGWVVYNFPPESDSLVEDLVRSQYAPNRVVILNLGINSNCITLEFKFRHSKRRVRKKTTGD